MGRAGAGGPRHPGLTRRQRDIVCFYRDHYQRHGSPPTLREIGAAVGLKSTSSVDYQVRELQRKGYLSRDLGRPCTTRPRTPAMEDASQASSEPGEDGRTLVQVIGRLAAGGPITAVDLTRK
jgi:repressor LexA